MSWSIKFRNDPDSPQASIFYNVLYISYAVYEAWLVSSSLAEFWEGLTDIREGVIIDQMPVEYIEFVLCHNVQVFLDYTGGEVMPGSVQMHSSVLESRKVMYS